MTTTGTWKVQEGTATQFRPPVERFRSDKLSFYTVAVAPILSPDLSRYGNDYGNVPIKFTLDTDTFNREIGWIVSGWHWSTVRNGGVLGAGDVVTIAEAKASAEATVRSSLGRKRSVIDAVWPVTPVDMAPIAP